MPVAKRVKAKTKPMPAADSAESLILRAIERNSPVATIERLLALRAEQHADAARRAYRQAITNFQGSCPAIPKTTPTLVQNANGTDGVAYYAPLEIMVATITPHLQRYNLSYSFQTRIIEHPPAQVVTCTIHHIDGHSEPSEFYSPLDGAGRNNEARQVNARKTQTIDKRYALSNALGLVFEDDTESWAQESQPENNAPAAENIAAAFIASAPELRSLPDLNNAFAIAQRRVRDLGDLDMDTHRVVMEKITAAYDSQNSALSKDVA